MAALSPDLQARYSYGWLKQHPRDLTSDQASELDRIVAALEAHAYCESKRSPGSQASWEEFFNLELVDARNKRLHVRTTPGGESSWYPLIWAAKENQLLIAERLIDRGCNLDQQEDFNDQQRCGYAAIHWAAQKGHTKIVELLLSRGADAGLKDKHGNAALALAKKKGHQEICAILEAAVRAKTGPAQAEPTRHVDMGAGKMAPGDQVDREPEGEETAKSEEGGCCIA